MNKMLYKVILFVLVAFIPVSASAMGHVDVGVRIPLPPPLFFPLPPSIVVIPETDVYVVPDIQEDIFFYGGWWWRPWQNRWYRSRYHDRDWSYYKGSPPFHGKVPHDWRNHYNQHQWEHYRVPHRDAERNWNTWQKNKHWEKHNYWGVRGLDQRQKQQKKYYQGKNTHGAKDNMKYRRYKSGQSGNIGNRSLNPGRTGDMSHKKNNHKRSGGMGHRR